MIGIVWGSLEHIVTIIDTLSEYSFFGFLLVPMEPCKSFGHHVQGGSENIFKDFNKFNIFNKLLFEFVVSNPFHVLEVWTKIKSKFSNLSPLPNSSTPDRTLHKYQKVGNLWNIFLAKIVKSTIVLVSIATDIWLRVAVKYDTMMICLSTFTVVCWITALFISTCLTIILVVPENCTTIYFKCRLCETKKLKKKKNDKKPCPALNFWSQKWSETKNLLLLLFFFFVCFVLFCFFWPSIIDFLHNQERRPTAIQAYDLPHTYPAGFAQPLYYVIV